MNVQVLDATNKSIEAVMSGAPATTNPSFTAGWADDNGTSLTEGASVGALNGNTPATIVAAPAASTRRVIKTLTICNIDTAPVTVTISYNNNTTLRVIATVTLAVGDTWTNEGTFDSAGNIKTATTGGTVTLTVGSTTIGSGTNTRILYDNSGVLGEYTITGSGTVVAMATAPTFVTSITTPAVLATANDSGALGASGTAFSDLFLASGGVINWDSGDVTITHASNNLLFAGASSGYTFDAKVYPTSDDGAALGDTTHNFSDLFLASGAVINYANSNVVITHTSGILTMGTGEMRITTPGTNSASVVTLGAAQTLTSKTISSGIYTGAQALSEGASIQLDPAGSADGAYTGITITGTAGYTQAFGDLVYLDPTDSRWEAADANSAAGADGDSRGILAMVVSAGTDGNACTLLLVGVIRADAKFPSFTVNNPIYVSETAGSVTQTQPTTTDVVIRVVGAALTADEMYFNPDFSYITHT